MKIEEEINHRASLSWFTKSTGKYKFFIVELAVVAIVIRLIGLVQPFVFQALIDRVLPFQRVSSLQIILVVLVGTTVFSVILGILSGLLNTSMANRLISEFGRRIYDHSLKLPLVRLQRFHVGEILARIGEIRTVRTFLTGTISESVVDLIFVVIYLLVLLAISPFLTMIVAIMLPLQVLLFGAMGPFIRARLQDRFQAEALLQSQEVEAYGNVITVKSLSSENQHVSRLADSLNLTLKHNLRVEKFRILSEAVGEFLNGVSVILVIYYGSQLVFISQITLGQLIAFHLLAEKIYGPIFSLSKIWEKWQELNISRFRLGDLLNPATEDAFKLPALNESPSCVVKVENLTFGYVPNVPILQNLSFTCSPGIPTIIIGDSGHGKSTLAKLVCGLYKPWEGKITLNDLNIADYSPFSVRQRIGYVAQEPILFAGTILQNLLLASPNATPKAIEVALAASACRFVSELPLGINTQVGDRGQSLSGGQRQRIALARSLLSNPNILVLDEPTSSQDETSAKIVMQTLEDLATKMTVIIVTHRPDLIKGRSTILDLNQLIKDSGEFQN